MLEQHPVPQNVTTFQFRLIGDMTLKQFAYLAGGAILAYVSFNLPLPFFFTYPLTGIFALGGIGFAFVPIEERPMDIWFVSFIKSIYSPTQYIWQREAPQPTITRSSSIIPGYELLFNIVSKILPPPQKPTSNDASTTTKKAGFSTLPTIEIPSFTSLLKNNKTQQIPPLPKQTSPTPPEYATIMASAPIPPTQQKTPIINQQANPVQPNTPSTPYPSDIEERFKRMEEQLIYAQNEKKKLEQELLLIKQQLTTPQNTTISPPVVSNQPIVIDQMKQPPMPSISLHPNVIGGIVREYNGNMLVGILVTVKDKDDVPVRALKTNKLGQFAASTPLPNGTYTIEAEDPKKQFAFEQEEVVLTGIAVPPLQLIAKSKQQLERQQLEHALFGNANQQ